MTIFLDYCPVCCKETEQRETKTEELGHSIECMTCNTVWDAEVNEMETEDDEN